MFDILDFQYIWKNDEFLDLLYGSDVNNYNYLSLKSFESPYIWAKNIIADYKGTEFPNYDIDSKKMLNIN